MRKNHRVTVLTAGAVLAVLTVAGCGAGQSASSTTTNTNSAASDSSNGTASGATTGQDSSAHTGTGTCTTADLSAKLGARRQINVDPQGQLGAAGTHYQINLVWTNTSSSTCTMSGFGGVDLDGAQNSAGGPTYSLPRTSDTPTAVKLPPGASAHTTISCIARAAPRRPAPRPGRRPT